MAHFIAFHFGCPIFNPISSLQNINNRDSIVHKRNKLNDVTKGNTRKPNNDTQFNNNSKKNNIVKNNQLNGALKNDTYESVCSPEDVAERTKMAQRHSLNNCNGNNSIGSNSSSSSGSMALNNARNFKRGVSSSPPNEIKSKSKNE